MRDTVRALAALAITCLFACGGGNGPGGGTPDASPPPPPTPDSRPAAVCGNNVVEDGEDCDDGDTGADEVCTADCKYVCGNGVRESHEKCDTAIASGEDACPTACADDDACTTDSLVNSACQAQCNHAPITARGPVDGCCPAGANALEDMDCDPVCGNDVVENPETCDTGIDTGEGSCPTACEPRVCSRASLERPGTCTAVCSYTAITAPANDDGCCPPGADDRTDNDCPRTSDCGNGRRDDNETCDTAIPAGQPNACPTSCAPRTCESVVLERPGTCTAACAYTPITAPANSDGCCPSGANANNDNDCRPECGNRVIEAGEQCDDGNSNQNDGCHLCRTVALPPTAFRLRTLTLRDPHVWTGEGILCFDITGTVNDLVTSRFNDDTDRDGDLDLSPTLIFRPLSQNQSAGPVDLNFATCTPPANAPGGPACRPGEDPSVTSTATNLTTGTCLATVPGTTRPYNPPVTTTTATAGAPCFSSDDETIILNLAGVQIRLTSAKFAARYSGNPASELVDGMIRGFISETDANNSVLPADLPVVGGKRLSELLPGGTGNCRSNPNVSDKDTLNGVSGWWFYLNYTGYPARWTD